MRTFHPDDDSTPTLSVAAAQQRVLDAIAPVGVEEIPLTEAAGRVLREEVVAPYDLPPADNSAMDGYAVVAADTEGASHERPAVLRVVEDIAAGRLPSMRVERGTAARIMTGGIVPDGADAIAQVELTDAGRDAVRIFAPVKTGMHLRRRGEDVRSGQVILSAGTRLRAGELAVLAAVGKASILASRRPRVAILSTGDELRELGAAPEPGTIVNSNSYALAALAAEAGAVAELRGIVRDTREATIAAIESSLDCDFVVSSGGVSAGAFDFVKESLDALGAVTNFWRVAMKPGKPVLFARLRDRAYFGLPGNPVSSIVGFLLFVAPALRKAAGMTSDLLPPLVNVMTDGPLRGSADRTTFVRVRVAARDGVLIASPMPLQGSHISRSMVGANGFAVIEPASRTIDAGSQVPVLLFALPFA